MSRPPSPHDAFADAPTTSPRGAASRVGRSRRERRRDPVGDPQVGVRRGYGRAADAVVFRDEQGRRAVTVRSAATGFILAGTVIGLLWGFLNFVAGVGAFRDVPESIRRIGVRLDSVLDGQRLLAARVGTAERDVADLKAIAPRVDARLSTLEQAASATKTEIERGTAAADRTHQTLDASVRELRQALDAARYGSSGGYARPPSR